MHPIEAFVRNPVKVWVGVILVVLFGTVAWLNMPMQLTPEVQIPTISIETRWPGATPLNVEQEIVQEQEEQLKGVEGVTKMSSESADSLGRITLEFAVGTNMEEALLRVNSRLQQVPEYPEDADQPVISTSSASDSPIAWFILATRPPEKERFDEFLKSHPGLKERILYVLGRSDNPGIIQYRLHEVAEEHPEALALIFPNVTLESLRTQSIPLLRDFPDLEPQVTAALATEEPGVAIDQLRKLAQEFPELAPLVPREQDVNQLRKFMEDSVEANLERVPGVSNANVIGGVDPELQVIVDPEKLAARQLTIGQVRDVLRGQNIDTSAGDVWEGKRRYVIRTLSQFKEPEEVENQLLAIHDGAPVFVRDVAEVRLSFKKPSGFVRRFGQESIALNVIRETGANVLDVMDGLRVETAKLNDGVLKQRGLIMTQVYDETEYIHSSINLVRENLFTGSALTMIVLMIFLHLNMRTLLFAPLVGISALAAVYISPWLFGITILLIAIAGFWFARGALVIALAIPVSIVGTFLILDSMGRSLNVISLAGMAFAVGMLVDNAVVVLEQIYSHSELGDPPMVAAERATKEVWGAVLASTLTTLAVFVPVVYVKEEAGQLFGDIALAISGAIGLSLIVSITLIPTVAARLLKKHGPSPADRPLHEGNGDARHRNVSEPRTTNSLILWMENVGIWFVSAVASMNVWIQGSLSRRLGVAGAIVAASFFLSYLLWPKVEYLPNGNRNLVIGIVQTPPGYSVDEMARIGEAVEDALKPYWNRNPDEPQPPDQPFPAIADMFFVVRDRQVIIGLRAADPLKARGLIPAVFAMGDKMPGSFAVAFQTSLFARGLQGGRVIDIEINGPDLDRLRGLGMTMLTQVPGVLEPDAELATRQTQARPIPSLDPGAAEIQIHPKLVQSRDLGVNAQELGYSVNALIDGAYASDFYTGGDKIDLSIVGQPDSVKRTQDVESLSIATPSGQLVPLSALADVKFGLGPEQVNHRERQRALTIQVTPPPAMALEDAIQKIDAQIIGPMRESGQLPADYMVNLSGTADKLNNTWVALRGNVILALLITYLLMAALFESWSHPLVIILSVPLGAVGGILGLQLLNVYLLGLGEVPQALDVLTMLGFVILIGTVVNNPILIVHQGLLHIREDGMSPQQAILESVKSRIRPIFMTTVTTLIGLIPLVLMPGAGSELYRGLGAVVLGGLAVSTAFTLILVPALFTLMLDLQQWINRLLGRQDEEHATHPPPPRLPAREESRPATADV
jgi:HAE1 family hydrophobic/amphiphilic exporter-1